MTTPQPDELVTSPSSLEPTTPAGGPESRYGLLLSQHLPPNKWDSLLNTAFNRAWTACTKLEDDGWEFNQEQMGIKVYLKPAEDKETNKNAVPYCKGIGTIPSDIETVRSVFACSEIKAEWDQMYLNGRVVELIDPNTVIAYATFKGAWPISGRDFCSIGRSIVLTEEQGGGVFVFYTSVEHPGAPVVSKFVRGDLKFNGLLMQPNKEDPTKTDVSYCVAQDPKGSLPKAIIEVANLLQPRTIAVVRDLIASKPTLVQQALAYEKKKFQDAMAITMTATSASDSSNSGTIGSVSEDGEAAGSATFELAQEGDFSQDDYAFSVVQPTTELTPEQKQHLDDAFEKGWKSTHEDDGWDYHKEIEGVKIWMKPSGTGPVKLSKGIGIINASPSHTHMMFTNESTRKEWDSMFNHGSTVEQIDTNTYIGYGAFDAPWPISGRDFTTITRTALLKDGSIFHWSTNFVTPKCPPNAKFVRGKLLFSGLLISPIENGTKSKITYAIGSDPSGSLPAAVAEAAALSQPLCIAAIGKVVAKNPAIVQQAIAASQAKYDKITGAGSGFNIAKETLPSIGSIEWPSKDDVASSDDKPGTGLQWLQPLHNFAQTTTFNRLMSSVSYARENGGVFRTLSTDFVNTKNENNQDILSKNLPFGQLAMKVTHLRGKYLSVLNNMLLYFTVTFENAQIKTGNAPYFDGVLPIKKDKHGDPIPPSPIDPSITNHFTRPVTRHDSVVLIELWGEQRQETRPGVSRACLGSLRLTLGELFEGDVEAQNNRSNNSIGSGNPTKARRCWFPLTNVPIEIDRTCTHYELLQHKTKTGRSKLSTRAELDADAQDGIQYLDDPRGLFICFESCVVFSSLQLYMNDLLSIEHSHAQYSNPRSTLAAMSLSLPPSLCKHPKNLLELAPTPKDPELCRQVGLMAITLTGGSLLTSDIEPDDLAVATSTFSAHLTVRNVIRCLVAVSPLLTMVNILYDLITWQSPVHTLFTMFLWVFICFHPYLIIPLLALFTLYSITLSAADHHFLQAASRSNTTYATTLKQRYIIAQHYTDQLQLLIPQLSPRSQAIGVLIQVICGRLATILESGLSLFQWGRLNDNALTMVIISFFSLLLSLYYVFNIHLPAFLLGYVSSSSHSGNPLINGISGPNGFELGFVNAVKNAASMSSNDPSLSIETANQLLPRLLDTIFSSAHSTQSTMLLVAPITIIFPVLLFLTWNSGIMMKLKLLLGSFFRSNLVLQHLRRESRTVRLFSGEAQNQ